MAARVDEVEATVDSAVDNIATIQSTLVLQVFLILSINVLNDGLVARHTATPI